MSHNSAQSPSGDRDGDEPFVGPLSRVGLGENGQSGSTGDEPAKRPFLSVVIPAYNEEQSVAETVRRIAAMVAEVCDDAEIIVVDDGSEDGTPAQLRAVVRTVPSARIVRNERNFGKGRAIRDGCQAATGRYVLLMDADGELTTERIERFVDRVRETDADVVVGSKRHPESEVSYPLQRRLLSRAYSLLIRVLFGLEVADTQVGMKLLRAEAVEEVMPLVLVDRYAFDVELLTLADEHGYEITEAPVSLQFDGNSSIDWRAVCRIGWDTLTVFCRLHVFGSYDKLRRAVSYVDDTESGARSERSE